HLQWPSKAYPLLNRRGSSHLPQQLKFTTSDSCDRIKDEFQLLQAQYHSLKLECDKLASEKSEMQRHYVMYYEMSYGLNIEMHKQVRRPPFHTPDRWAQPLGHRPPHPGLDLPSPSPCSLSGLSGGLSP
uniref:Groucho/TLE N-terminal Q-rich domain-containing protein n=1 Tax=Ursus maritimus TaxID=29073 RepID=A0A452TMR2_URSMA